MKKLILVVASLAFCMASTQVFAQTQQRDTTRKDTAKTTTTKVMAPPVTAGGDIATVIAGTTDYSSLAAAVKAAGLEAMLKSAGPYTVFAPNDAGFSKVPKAQLDSLLKNPVALSTILKTHIVNGKYTKADIIAALKAGKGKATLKTLNGDDITLSVNDKSNLQITDAAGNISLVTSFDMQAINGVVHGINLPLIKQQ